MYWIVSYNEKYFRLSDFFNDKQELDWIFERRYSFQIGDRVYLYCSHPYSKITYEVKVIQIDVPFDDYIDDSQYGGTVYLSLSEYSKSFHIRFRLIRKIDNDNISYSNLLQHGLKGSIRTPIKCTGELLDFIKKSLITSPLSSKLTLLDCIDLIEKPDSDLYTKYVPQFIKEAKSGKNWSEWNKDVFNYYFEKASNGVAFLGNGQMTRNDRQTIKDHWMELAPHLKRIAENQDVPLWDEYKEIRTIIRKYTTTNKRIATNRMLAGLQPYLLCTEIDINKLNELLDYIQKYTTTSVPNYDRNNWEIASHTFINLIKRTMPELKISSLFYLPYKLLGLFRDEQFSNKIISSDYDEITNPDEIFEGAKKEIFVNAYERNPLARQKCIEANGCYCHVCGLDFKKMYGEIGDGFIQVHHKIPISTIGKEYKIDPINDLVPVCPNCHAMLHRGNNGEVLSIEELRDMLKNIGY